MNSEGNLVLEKVPESERRDFSIGHVSRSPGGGSFVPEEGWVRWGQKRSRECFEEVLKSDFCKGNVTPVLAEAMSKSIPGVNAGGAIVHPVVDEYGRPPGVEISWNKMAEILDKHGRKDVRPPLLPKMGPRVDHSSMLEYLMLCDRAKTFNNVGKILYWEGEFVGDDGTDPHLPKFLTGSLYYHPNRRAYDRGWTREISGHQCEVVGDDCRVFETGAEIGPVDLLIVHDQYPVHKLDQLLKWGVIDDATGIYARKDALGITTVWQRVNKYGVVLSRMVATCGDRRSQPVISGVVTHASSIQANISDMLSDNVMQVGWPALSRVRYVVVLSEQLLSAQRGNGVPRAFVRGEEKDKMEWPNCSPGSFQFQCGLVTEYVKEDIEDCDVIPCAISMGTIVDNVVPVMTEDEMCAPPSPFVPAEAVRLIPGEEIRYPVPRKWNANDLAVANHVHGATIHQVKEGCNVVGSHICTLEVGRMENLRLVRGDGGVPKYVSGSINRQGVLYPIPDEKSFSVPRDTYVDPPWNTIRCPAEVMLVPMRLRANVEWPNIKITLIESGDIWAAVRLYIYVYTRLGKLGARRRPYLNIRAEIERKMKEFEFPNYNVVWNVLVHDLDNPRGKKRNRAVYGVDRGWVHDYVSPPKNGEYDYAVETDLGPRLVYELVMLLIPVPVKFNYIQ